jgi:hypothetical protein
MQHAFCRLVFCARLAGIAYGHDDAATSNALNGPALKPLFEDNFTNDTRTDYDIAGDAAWQDGRLTLKQGGSITRSFKCGTRARVGEVKGRDSIVRSTLRATPLSILKRRNTAFLGLTRPNGEAAVEYLPDGSG